MLIYLITNKVNGKIYVGQTRKTIEKRWRGHVLAARAGASLHLYNAIRKYGPDNFEVQEIASAVSLDELNQLEMDYIKKLRAANRRVGYNMTMGGGGGVPTLEVRRKISKANTGRKASDQTRQRLSLSHKGKVLPLEQRKKIGESGKRAWKHRSHTVDRDIVERVAAKKRGVPLTPEHREKIAAKLRGIKRTPEQCEAIRQRMQKVGWIAKKTKKSERLRIEAARKAIQFNPPNLAELYQSHLDGEAVGAMARRIGVKEGTLKSAFLRSGMRLRSHVESQQMRWKVASKSVKAHYSEIGKRIANLRWQKARAVAA
jgi:group I intron endonuclease